MRRYNVTTVVVAKNIAFQSAMLLAPILVGKVCFVYLAGEGSVPQAGRRNDVTCYDVDVYVKFMLC